MERSKREGGQDGEKADEGRRLDHSYHILSQPFTRSDRRKNTKEKANIELRQTSAKFRYKYHRKTFQEKLRDSSGNEENKGRAEYMVQTLREQKNERARAKRGNILSFSKSSQRRCRDKLSELPINEMPLMLDMTFPDQMPTLEEAKKMFIAFEVRFLRAYPEVGAFWKEEVTRRKSGENKGKIAAHFHVLVYGLKGKRREFTRWAKQAWYEVVGSNDPRHKKYGVWVKEAYEKPGGRSFRSYLRKYIGKRFELEGLEGIGRLWGYFGNVPFGTVFVMEEDTSIVFAVMRWFRKREEALYRQWHQTNILFRAKSPPPGNRFFDTASPARVLDMVNLAKDNRVPF
jgi:hypothetical protein